MRIRLTFVVHNPGISKPSELVLRLPSSGIAVTLRRDEQSSSPDQDWIAQAEVARKMNIKLQGMLAVHKERIAAYRAGTAPAIPANEIPAELVAFADQLSRELSDAIRRVLNTIRWRLRYRGPHDPVRSTKGIAWLAEDSAWYPLPTSVHTSLEITSNHDISPLLHAEFLHLLNTDAVEPVAHALFREAWQQRGSNQRSSLLIGVAAAEVGAKSCIATLAPQTTWLIENMPSPSLETLLRDYFPTLPTRGNARQISAMPKEVVDAVRKAVRMRNQLAHARPPNIDPDTLESLLETISDLLSYFDYICGYTWTLRSVHGPLRQAIREP